jgi:hypothetical protein
MLFTCVYPNKVAQIGIPEHLDVSQIISRHLSHCPKFFKIELFKYCMLVRFLKMVAASILNKIHQHQGQFRERFKNLSMHWESKVEHHTVVGR